jgi:hypothetical protein
MLNLKKQKKDLLRKIKSQQANIYFKYNIYKKKLHEIRAPIKKINNR